MQQEYGWAAELVRTFRDEKRLDKKLKKICKEFHSSSGWFMEQGADFGDDKWRVSDVRTASHWPCFNTLRTGDADLRFYITTVQDG
jgi:hypothetical protein